MNHIGSYGFVWPGDEGGDDLSTGAAAVDAGSGGDSRGGDAVDAGRDGGRARVGGRIASHAARDDGCVDGAEEGGRFSTRVFVIFNLGNEIALITNGSRMTDTPPCASTVRWNSTSCFGPVLAKTHTARSSTFDADSSEPISSTIVRAFMGLGSAGLRSKTSQDVIVVADGKNGEQNGKDLKS